MYGQSGSEEDTGFRSSLLIQCLMSVARRKQMGTIIHLGLRAQNAGCQLRMQSYTDDVVTCGKVRSDGD